MEVNSETLQKSSFNLLLQTIINFYDNLKNKYLLNLNSFHPHNHDQSLRYCKVQLTQYMFGRIKINSYSQFLKVEFQIEIGS